VQLANDELHCGPEMGKDVRSTEYRLYAADVGTYSSDKELLVEKDFSTTKELDVKIEGRLGVSCTPDMLTIKFSDPTPTQYW